MNEETTQNTQSAAKPISIKANFIYSLLNKAVAVLIPILITPYLSRVLEPDGNGVISYVNSIASYFVLVANLGIETYGQRTIAAHRDDKAYLKKFVIEVSILRFILTALCMAVYYVIFISSFNTVNNKLYAIQSLMIIAVAVDFSWFFQGLENFRLLALSNLASRLVYVVCTFLFVKTKEDINIAALLAMVNTVLPFVLSAPFIFRYFGCKTEGKINPFRHLKNCLIYFIPTVAIQIYTVLDKTMLGLIVQSDFENGYYDQVEKIVKLPLTVLISLNIIMRSRISYFYELGELDKIHGLAAKAINATMCFVLPVMAGVFAIAKTFVPVYLGEGYEKCVPLMYIFAPIIPIIGLSNLYSAQYYTPYDKQPLNNWFLIAGAVLNLALNSVLIYYLQSLGAAIASVCAELLVLVLCIIFAKDFVPFTEVLKISVKYLIAAAVMFVPVFLMNYFLSPTLPHLLAEVGVGVAVYAAMLFILRTRFVLDLTLQLFEKVKHIFRRKKN